MFVSLSESNIVLSRLLRYWGEASIGDL